MMNLQTLPSQTLHLGGLPCLSHQTTDSINLAAYFQRIGYGGDRTPTLETLQAIHQCHTVAIAFENLNPFLHQPVHIDVQSLQQKLIHRQRGGYCFEQNMLLRAVLIELGFKVTNLSARVLWNRPEGILTTRTHMLLLVEIDETPFIADVGFGGFTYPIPLRLTLDIEQHTSLEDFRLIKANDNTFVVQAKVEQIWKPLYHFDLQVQHRPDYEVSNWYVSTHPDSIFTNNLILARIGIGQRYALRNTQLTIHHQDGRVEQHSLNSVKALRTAMTDIFLLQPSECWNLDSALQSLIERANQDSKL
jgi:N-hydroxyarylamine O-acetyltransferase